MLRRSGRAGMRGVMRGTRRPAAFFTGAILACLPIASAAAHDFSIVQVVAVIKTDGTYLIDMRISIDALSMGLPPSTHSAALSAALRKLTPEELKRSFDQAHDTILRRVRIRFDGKKVVPLVTFPEYEHPLNVPGVEPTVFGTTARLSGRYPEGAKTFTFGASRAFNAVQLTILDEATGSGVKHVLSLGENSPPYRLNEKNTENGGLVVSRYLVLGFEHILPKGLDHILFVLGLYLLSTRLRPLLWQITAFTVAHSVTLALSMTDIASLSSRIVEPLIAVSITYVAVENMCVRELKPWRPAVVFAFGLLHGMGFAGVLRDLGMPQGQFAAALVGFNVGVECGQLAVVTTAFLVVGWFRNRPWYRKTIVVPCSLVIALVGAYWAIQRSGLAF